MEKTLAPSLRSEPGGPAAQLVKRACYCAGAVDGVVEGSCKVVLQATGAAAEAAGDRLAAVVEGAETWLVERSAHLVTSAYVAAGASAGKSAQPQPQCIALHCIAPERHPRHPCSRGFGCTHTATAARCPLQVCTRAARGLLAQPGSFCERTRWRCGWQQGPLCAIGCLCGRGEPALPTLKSSSCSLSWPVLASLSLPVAPSCTAALPTVYH